jgi:Cu/Ag efflux pump CusA
MEFTLHESERSRAEILEAVRERLDQIPGILVNVGQPLSHRIDHVLSGVRAQLAIKIFGDDLRLLRDKAAEIESLIASVDGIVDLSIEQLVLTQHIHVNVDRDRTLNRGMTIGEVAEYAQVALNGKTVSEIIDGQQSYDLVVRFEDRARNSLAAISRLPVWTPQESFVPLNLLARIEEAKGPNLINRENGQRRIIVQANVAGRDIVSVVDDITGIIAANVELPEGYFVTFGGQFESQASAFRTIVLLGFVAFVGMFVVLFAHFKSVNFALQVMLSIPLSFIGGIIGVMITNNVISIATIVGFIALAGIASRNGILMISHYMHLLHDEGELFDRKMITRGTQERIIPVLMTALAASLALIPLLLGANEPGREMLWPVAIVIFSGMISSTFLDLTLRPLVFWKFGHKEAIRLKESWRD